MKRGKEFTVKLKAKGDFTGGILATGRVAMFLDFLSLVILCRQPFCRGATTCEAKQRIYGEA
ncbi:MAG: hypothetical protein GX989_04370 [Firmicutes bacterium]|nr:hypothetical protein [Bacillota bacterium]